MDQAKYGVRCPFTVTNSSKLSSSTGGSCHEVNPHTAAFLDSIFDILLHLSSPSHPPIPVPFSKAPSSPKYQPTLTPFLTTPHKAQHSTPKKAANASIPRRPALPCPAPPCVRDAGCASSVMVSTTRGSGEWNMGNNWVLAT